MMLNQLLVNQMHLLILLLESFDLIIEYEQPTEREAIFQIEQKFVFMILLGGVLVVSFILLYWFQGWVEPFFVNEIEYNGKDTSWSHSEETTAFLQYTTQKSKINLRYFIFWAHIAAHVAAILVDQVSKYIDLVDIQKQWFLKFKESGGVECILPECRQVANIVPF